MPRFPFAAAAAAISLLFGVAGCTSTIDEFSDAEAMPYEIAANPKLLLDPATPVEKVSLYGIRLGDDESAIPEIKIHERDTRRGWVFMRDPIRYRIVNGKVVTLGCWDQRVLSRLGVRTQEDVERVFGKAEGVYELSPSNVSYHYQDGQKRAIWNKFENRLGAVNVGRPAVSLEPEPEEKTPSSP